MRARTPWFLAVFTSSVTVLAAMACGGGTEAKAPTGGPEASSRPEATAEAATGSGPSGPSEGSGTTTTMQLGDAGDLQGAKLGSSSRKEVETKGEGGPKPPPGGSQEPGRTAKDIQAIIGARRDEARACYDRGLRDHPGIEGDLDVKWKIDPQGNVTDAEVDTMKSQILEPGVGGCIVDIIKKIKFAPSAKGFETRAHYPFNFHPRNAPGARVDAGK